MSRRSRSLNLLEPQEPREACSGKPLPFTWYRLITVQNYPWIGFLLEKLIVSYVFNTYAAFFGARKCIRVTSKVLIESQINLIYVDIYFNIILQFKFTLREWPLQVLELKYCVLTLFLSCVLHNVLYMVTLITALFCSTTKYETLPYVVFFSPSPQTTSVFPYVNIILFKIFVIYVCSKSLWF